MTPIEPRQLVLGIASVLLPLILADPGSVAVGGEGNPNRAAMADAMSRMMESMGLMGAGGDAAKSIAGEGVPGLPLGQAGEAGTRMLEGMTSGVVGTGAALEGVWEGAGGGLLIVQGDRYRIYAPNWSAADGTLQVSGNRLQMVNRRANFNLAFEYALDQGRLALRDDRGQVLLYRRLVLNGGD
ncbi:MAG TPA: hypothetical protein VES73_06965 [Lamprocystis sp. (in: g-proteobacteria)]|nr:hypothetical protein [Lamprocystis sp. (in: g-proteobacteria)]